MSKAKHSSDDAGFFFAAALLVLSFGLLGFGPSFIAAAAAGFSTIPMRVHIHGVFMVGWLLLVAFQAWLIWRGHNPRHRIFGRLGVILFALAYLSMGVLAFNNLMKEVPPFVDEALGKIFALQVKALIIVPIMFALALWQAPRDSAGHRRLMIILTASMMGAAVVRMGWLPGIDGLRSHILAIHAYNLLPVLVVPTYDLLKLGKLHRSTQFGVVLILASMAAVTFAWYSPTWITFTRGIETFLLPFWPNI